MKTRAITSLLTVVAGCTLAFAQSKFIPEDDIYYQPNETNKVVESKKAAYQKENAKRNSTEYQNYNSTQTVASGTRDVDEYNRRYTSEYNEEYDNNTADTTPTQQNRVQSQDAEVIYENPETGYYLNNFNGN
ncbi:MAG: hypothetical protein RR346_06105, partial [Bacteroidales bacterium]